MQRWVRGAPNSANDADQAPPEDDLLPEPDALGLTPGGPTDGTAAGTQSAAIAHGAADFGIDLGWLPEPGRTQAMSGRAAAYDNTGRCAYHLAPFGCTLVDGDADGPGLIEPYGRKPAGQLDGSPDVRAGSSTQPTGARPTDAPNAAEPSAEVHKRSANLMTWCERCAIGIHFWCADDHAIGHSGDDHIGDYGAKDIAAQSFLCNDFWSTHKPCVDESDEEEIESDNNPERHPNRLRWRWPDRLKEALDAAARRERAASAVVSTRRRHTPPSGSTAPLSQPNLRRWLPNARTGRRPAAPPRAAAEHTSPDPTEAPGQ